MRLRRAAPPLVLGLVVLATWTLVLRDGAGDRTPNRTPEPPSRLIDLDVDSVERLVVRDPASGMETVLVPADESFAAHGGVIVPADDLRRLHADLFPLLAIRTFEVMDPLFGLDTPTVVVDVVTARQTITLAVGAENFDGTGVYAVVDSGRVALILTRVAATLRDLVGTDQAAP